MNSPLSAPSDDVLLSCFQPHILPLSQLPPSHPVQPPEVSHLKQTRRAPCVLKLLKSVVALRQPNEWLWFPAAKLRVRTAPHARSLGRVGHLTRLHLSSHPAFALFTVICGWGKGWLQRAWNFLSTSERSVCLDWTLSARSMRDPCSAAKNTFMPNPALHRDRHPQPRPKWASPATCRSK
jgi:hypothetical protein